MAGKGKPFYESEGDCPICGEWREKAIGDDGKRCCDQCGQTIPPYPEVPSGYMGPDTHHWHLSPVMGIAGRESVRQVLCRPCYLAARAIAYPDAAVPELADWPDMTLQAPVSP